MLFLLCLYFFNFLSFLVLFILSLLFLLFFYFFYIFVIFYIFYFCYFCYFCHLILNIQYLISFYVLIVFNTFVVPKKSSKKEFWKLILQVPKQQQACKDIWLAILSVSLHLVDIQK